MMRDAGNDFRRLASLSSLPDLVQDTRSKSRLVLGQEAPIVLCDHVGGVLDGVARLLIRASLLQDMGREHVPDIMRTVR